MVTIDSLESKDGKTTKVSQQMGLIDAFELTFEQCIKGVGTREMNPIWKFLYQTTGRSYAFTSEERMTDANSLAVRECLRKYIRSRKAGHAKSQVGNNSDLLSLFLSNPDVFTEEVIIDECFGFIVAGT